MLERRKRGRTAYRRDRLTLKRSSCGGGQRKRTASRAGQPSLQVLRGCRHGRELASGAAGSTTQSSGHDLPELSLSGHVPSARRRPQDGELGRSSPKEVLRELNPSRGTFRFCGRMRRGGHGPAAGRGNQGRDRPTSEGRLGLSCAQVHLVKPLVPRMIVSAIVAMPSLHSPDGGTTPERSADASAAGRRGGLFRAVVRFSSFQPFGGRIVGGRHRTSRGRPHGTVAQLPHLTRFIQLPAEVDEA